MKDIGIVRNIDNLGRIVVPIEIRKTLGITSNDSVEIFVDDDAIILKKYQNHCIFCDGKDNLLPYGKQYICEQCQNRISKL